MEIEDTACQERYRTLNGKYFKDTDGILLVFDMTDYPSFEKITYWMEQITEYAFPDEISVVVENKSILTRGL